MPASIERKNLAEDVLSYVLAHWLRTGELIDDWKRFVAGAGVFVNANSANHKGMAACCGLIAGQPWARTYWLDRFEKERSDFCLGEPLGKYMPWDMGSVAVVWLVAEKRGERELQALAEAHIRAATGLLALGAAPKAAVNLTGEKWGGAYVSGVGVRADLGHLDGDQRAWLFQRLVQPLAVARNQHLANAQRRVMSAWETKAEGDAEIERRKVASELWAWDAFLQLQERGFKLPEADRTACRLWMEEGTVEALEGALTMLGGHATRHVFHWLRWADGRRAAFLEQSLGERCVFGDLYDPSTRTATLAFPYDEADKGQKGGRCDLAGARLSAQSAFDEAAIELPRETPAFHVWCGPKGAGYERGAGSLGWGEAAAPPSPIEPEPEPEPKPAPKPRDLERRLLAACSAVQQQVRQNGIDGAQASLANLEGVLQEARR